MRWSIYFIRVLAVNKLLLLFILLISINIAQLDFLFYLLYLPFIIMFFTYAFRDAKIYIKSLNIDNGKFYLEYSKFFKRYIQINDVSEVTIEIIRNKAKFYNRKKMKISFTSGDEVIQYEILDWDEERMNFIKNNLDAAKK